MVLLFWAASNCSYSILWHNCSTSAASHLATVKPVYTSIQNDYHVKLLITNHFQPENGKPLSGIQKQLLSSKNYVTKKLPKQLYIKLRLYHHTASVRFAPKQPLATTSSTRVSNQRIDTKWHEAKTTLNYLCLKPSLVSKLFFVQSKHRILWKFEFLFHEDG